MASQDTAMVDAHNVEDNQPIIQTSQNDDNTTDVVLEAFNSAQNVRILPGSGDTAASFEFTGEDHTLGNALRYIIMKNPDVEFCGYSIPHPSEPKMNIRIQTYEVESGHQTTAFEALEKGFSDLADLCDVVGEVFGREREQFGQTA